MSRNSFVLIITCGVLTGFLFYVLTTVTLAVFAERALSVLQTAPTQPKFSGGQSANWVGLGFVPLDLVPVPLVTSLVCAIAATGIGAGVYTAVERHQSASQASASAG